MRGRGDWIWAWIILALFQTAFVNGEPWTTFVMAGSLIGSVLVTKALKKDDTLILPLMLFLDFYHQHRLSDIQYVKWMDGYEASVLGCVEAMKMRRQDASRLRRIEQCGNILELDWESSYSSSPWE